VAEFELIGRYSKFSIEVEYEESEPALKFSKCGTTHCSSDMTISNLLLYLKKTIKSCFSYIYNHLDLAIR